MNSKTKKQRNKGTKKTIFSQNIPFFFLDGEGDRGQGKEYSGCDLRCEMCDFMPMSCINDCIHGELLCFPYLIDEVQDRVVRRR